MKELIKQLVGETAEDVMVATIRSVDHDAATCNVETLSDGEIFNVRLRATVDGEKEGSILYPKVGSDVLIARLNNDNTDYCVLMFSALDEAAFTIEKAVFSIDKKGFTLQNDTESLKGILNEIVAQMLKIYAPKDVPGLTAINKRINTLLK